MAAEKGACRNRKWSKSGRLSLLSTLSRTTRIQRTDYYIITAVYSLLWVENFNKRFTCLLLFRESILFTIGKCVKQRPAAVQITNIAFVATG